MNRYTVEIRAPRKGETIINQGRVIEMPVDGAVPMTVVVDGSDRWPSGNAIFIEDAVCDGEEIHGTYAVRSAGWTYMLPDGRLIGKDTPNHEITAWIEMELARDDKFRAPVRINLKELEA